MQDSITGLLLAGVGHINEQQKKNFLIVDASACPHLPTIHCADVLTLTETQVSAIEAAFQEFTERKDIAILLINQHVRRIYISSALPSYTSLLGCGEDTANG